METREWRQGFNADEGQVLGDGHGSSAAVLWAEHSDI